MKVTCSWKISLPFKFQYTDNMNDIKTILINEIFFHPLISKDNIIDSIIAEYEVELPEDINEYSVANVHAFRKFRASVFGKGEHPFPETECS
ncbi:MAG TPA: hypothetical protein VM577_10240 [Anaerovoracaceae bacterium]|nr:hypothetical protein [Anaerovoracaceae bacterium]